MPGGDGPAGGGPPGGGGSSRLRRWLLLGTGAFAALLLVVAVGLTVYIKSIDFNSYIPMIQDAVLKATGRTLLIDGRMHVSLSLHPSLSVEGVHLANPPGFSRANTMDVERMDIEISLLPLLSGELLVDHITLQSPDILLERLPDGRDNWSVTGGELAAAGMSAPSEAPSGSTVLLPRVHRLFIRDAQIGYLADGQRQSLNIPQIKLWEDDGGKSDTRLHVLARGEFNKLPVSLQGTLGSLPALIDNQPLDVDVQAGLASVALHMSGSVQQPLDGKGMKLALNISAPGLDGLAKFLRLPQALDAPLSLSGSLSDDAHGYALQGLKAKLRGSDVDGEVRIRTDRSRPRVEANLHSQQLALTELLPASDKGGKDSAKPDAAAAQGGAGQAAAPKRVLPATPLDLSALKDMDAALTWKLGRVLLPEAPLSDVDAGLTLQNGKLHIQPLKLHVAGGDVSMQLDLDADRSPPTFSMKLTGRDIQPAELLAAAQQKGKEPLLVGDAVDADVHLAGQGTSVAGMLAHSNGRIKIRIGKGKVKSEALEVIGGDVLMTLADKLNPFAKSDPYMQLQCGVVHFRVEHGVMHSEKGIAFETERMNIISQGKVDLRDESIDLGIGTEPREGIGINLSNLVNVVRLGGTLASPGIRMDAAKTAGAAARTAGAVMTGGLSLLGEGLINRATADSTPCKTALDMK